MEELKLGTIYNDLQDACANAKLLIVLNNHKKYGTINDSPVFHKNGFEILDSWGVCSELYYAEGVKISTLGNMFN